MDALRRRSIAERKEEKARQAELQEKRRIAAEELGIEMTDVAHFDTLQKVRRPSEASRSGSDALSPGRPKSTKNKDRTRLSYRIDDDGLWNYIAGS